MALEHESQVMALKLSVEVGEEVVSFLPEVADMYREGKNQREIASEILTNSHRFRWVESENVLEHAVKYALIGNDNPHHGPLYDGLMSCDEYRAIALNNVTSNLNLNDEQKRKKHINGAISRGQRHWEEEEKKMALRFKSEGLGFREIARRLNDEYHHSGIRNRNCVYEMFRRMNGKKNSGRKIQKSLNVTKP